MTQQARAERRRLALAAYRRSYALFADQSCDSEPIMLDAAEQSGIPYEEICEIVGEADEDEISAILALEACIADPNKPAELDALGPDPT